MIDAQDAVRAEEGIGEFVRSRHCAGVRRGAVLANFRTAQLECNDGLACLVRTPARAREAWTTGKAGAKGLDLEATKSEIGKQSGLYTALIGACTDEFLSAEIEMFGRKASRAALLIGLVVNHFAAYRMQLFLYLKACGRDELSTINLWAGVDKF